MRSNKIDCEDDSEVGIVANNNQKECKIYELSASEAEEYFLRGEVYCTFDLPQYFNFGALLQELKSIVGNGKCSDFQNEDPKKRDNINHIIYANKDGKYLWRPYTLIHPLLYVLLVNTITDETNWKVVQERFNIFQSTSNTNCQSLSIIDNKGHQDIEESKRRTGDRSLIIRNWWENIELESISLSLKYSHILETDISDCYSSIYTHSIPWALHGKEEAKKKRSGLLLGDIIDADIRRMSWGQTDGIPQGSDLMNFIAEICLGYVDLELNDKLEELKKSSTIGDYHILRYRDDFKIFTNSAKDGEIIVKSLSEVLIDSGLKLNRTKTIANDIILKGAIKLDKWHRIKYGDHGDHGDHLTRKKYLQRLLKILDMSIEFPNSGSLLRLLNDFSRTIKGKEKLYNTKQLIAVIVDIAFRNPKTYPISCAILSQLLPDIEEVEQKDIIDDILNKFESIPNTGVFRYMVTKNDP